MILLWKVLPFIFASWLLMLLVPVRINLFFLRQNKDDFMTVRVNTLFSLIRFQFEIPFLKQTSPLDLAAEAELKAGEDELIREDKKKFSLLDLNWEKIRKYIAFLYLNRRLFRFTVRFITRATTVESFTLRIRGGMEDAALTGMLFGFLWSSLCTLMVLAQQLLTFRERPVLSLIPEFNVTQGPFLKLDTTVSMRIGHFAFVGMTLLFAKIRGGVKGQWKNILSRA